MKFTTEIPIARSEHEIKVSDEILLAGSCFAHEMGQWFLHRQFDVHLNPYGILFHPMVIARCLQRSIRRELYHENECVSFNGWHHSFDFHGAFSSVSEGELTMNANSALERTRRSLEGASTLILTWGSAWGYKWNRSGQWVSNCHKIPQSNFSKELVSSNEIVAQYQVLFNELWTINPKLQIIVSVSPVRYWRDGAHGNQLSKAHLLMAASQLAASNQQVHYFPAYEIMMDELRDYRFYNPDMLHPSAQAVAHIISKFQEMFFPDETNRYINQVEPLIKFLAHRPLHVDESEWQKLCAGKEQELQAIRQSYA